VYLCTMKQQEMTILSGMRPTGNLHLGNYFGAMKSFLQLQETCNCFFFIADYHLLTTHPHPGDLHNNVKTILAQYLACGLDPTKATIYVQSDVPQTVELYMFLNMIASLGELERCTSFKDKVRQNPKNVNAGLLTYPTLMAADILIHRATHVPVGKDQTQHLEMTRNFAQRFNSLYGVDYFTMPEGYSSSKESIKVPSLDGEGKMSKSLGEQSTIYLTDEDSVLKKKIMKAKTDSGPTQINQTKPEEIENIFSLMRLVSTDETINYFNDKWNDCSIRYGDMKKQLAQDMIAFITPIRERCFQLQGNEKYLSEVVAIGKEKAIASAQKTIDQVREIIGFKHF